MMAVQSGIINSPFTGISNFHIAKLLTDTAEGATYDEIISFPWLISVQTEPQTAEGTLYADNKAVDNRRKMGSVNLTINTATLPLEYRALLFGHEIDENGVLQIKSTDVAPYFALKYQLDKSNGKHLYVTWYKVKFSEPSENPQTENENIEYNTPTFSGTAVYREAGGIGAMIDEEAANYVDAVGENWYTSVEPDSSVDPTPGP